jgi:MFS family permease
MDNETHDPKGPIQSTTRFEMGGLRAHTIMLVCFLLYMINFMDRQVLSAVLEPMKHDIGLNDMEAGIVQTVFLLSIALFAFPASFLVDRWSRRKAIGLMAIGWSAFTFMTGLAKNFAVLVIPRAMVGIGEAGFTAGGTAMITAAYPKKSRGIVLGVFNIAIPLGSALGVILGGHISAYYGGWRMPFFVFAVPGIFLGVAAYFLPDYKTMKRTDHETVQAGFFKNIGQLLKIRSLRWLYAGYAMHNIMTIAVLVWVPAFLMRAHGISEAKAGLLMGMVALSAILGAPLGGWLADFWQKKNRRGRMLVPIIADSLAATLIIFAFILDLKGFGYVLAIGFGIIQVCANPAIMAVTQDVVPPWSKGMSWGLAQFFMYVPLGFLAPTIIGLISDLLGGGAYGLKVALISVSLAGFAGSAFFLVASKTYPADSEKVDGYSLEAERP